MKKAIIKIPLIIVCIVFFLIGLYKTNLEYQYYKSIKVDDTNLLLLNHLIALKNAVTIEFEKSATYLGNKSEKSFQQLKRIRKQSDKELKSLKDFIESRDIISSKNLYSKIYDNLKYARSRVDVMGLDYRDILFGSYQKNILDIIITSLNVNLKKIEKKELPLKNYFSSYQKLMKYASFIEKENALISYILASSTEMEQEDLEIWNELISKISCPQFTKKEIKILESLKIFPREQTNSFDAGIFIKRMHVLKGIATGKYPIKLSDWLKFIKKNYNLLQSNKEKLHTSWTKKIKNNSLKYEHKYKTISKWRILAYALMSLFFFSAILILSFLHTSFNFHIFKRKKEKKNKSINTIGIKESQEKNNLNLSATSSGTFAINDTFDDFKIKRFIGEGAVGKVYLAEQMSLNREVAIKVLSSNAMHEKNREIILKRFLNEAQLMASIRHPNIIDILKVGSFNDINFIVMEYVYGEPIDDFFKSKQFSQNKELSIWRIVLAVVKGLECALRNGIIHRDIKPDNILVTENGRPKICDFGISKKLSEDVDLTMEGEIVGSPHYISPEQISGKNVSYQSDMYSLGATIYTVLTNSVLFQSDAIFDILLKQRSAKPIVPNEINPEISDASIFILAKLLAKDKRERYLSYQDLILDITLLLKGKKLEYSNEQNALDTFEFTRDYVFTHSKKEKKKKKKLLIISDLETNSLCSGVYNSFETHVASSLEEVKYFLEIDKFTLVFDLDTIGVFSIELLKELKIIAPKNPVLFVSNDYPDFSTGNISLMKMCSGEMNKYINNSKKSELFKIENILLKDIIKLIEVFKWTIKLKVDIIDDESQSGEISFQRGKELEQSSQIDINVTSAWSSKAEELY